MRSKRFGNTLRRLAGMLCMGALAVSMSIPAFAADTLKIVDPDTINLSKAGSITINTTYDGTAIQGNSFQIYKVADLVRTGNSYTYQSTLTDKTMDASNIATPELAKQFYDLVKQNEETPYTDENFKTDANGQVTLEGLFPALYLVVQPDSGNADGYDVIAPFLVSIPWGDSYDVDSSPKPEITKAGEKNPPDDTDKPNTGSKLPQTGQLWWPVSILAAAGMVFILGGVIRKKHAE